MAEVVERVREEELIARWHERGLYLLQAAYLAVNRLAALPEWLVKGELGDQALFVDRGKPGGFAPDDDLVVGRGQDMVFQNESISDGSETRC